MRVRGEKSDTRCTDAALLCPTRVALPKGRQTMYSEKTHKLRDFDAERPASLQRRLTVPSPIPDSDLGLSAQSLDHFPLSSAKTTACTRFWPVTLSHGCTARRRESQAPPEKDQDPKNGQGGPPFRVMVLPTHTPPALPQPCFLSSLDNALIIVVVDAAGDHHTRLNPTLAPIASPTPSPSQGATPRHSRRSPPPFRPFPPFLPTDPLVSRHFNGSPRRRVRKSRQDGAAISIEESGAMAGNAPRDKHRAPGSTCAGLQH
jgi:hypothetical protein